MKCLVQILTVLVFSFNLAVAQETTPNESTKDFFTEDKTSVNPTSPETDNTPQPSTKTEKPRTSGFEYQFEAINSGNAERVAAMKDSIHYYRKNKEGETALTLAIQNQDVALVELLMKKAVVNLKNEQGETPLTLAIKKGNIDIINLVAKRAKASLKNEKGEAPLYLAIELDNIYLLEKLISKGAKVNRKSNGISPLARATELNKPKAVAFLLKNKAVVNQANDNGDTPLYIAINKGHDIIAGILLSKSEDPSGDANWKNKVGIPLIHLAAANGNAEILRVLIRNGAEVNTADYMDNTALSIAAELGDEKMVRTLIQSNANINHQNLRGDTPLMLASANKKDQITTILLENGADATIMNYSGYAAADFYSEQVFDNLFASRGAKQNTKKEATPNQTTNNNQLKETTKENNQ
jgi:ankyrin repeat protein